MHPIVRIATDPAELARLAAEEFVGRSRESVASCGRFVAALSGGTTPRDTYALLAEPEYRDRVDWTRVKLFQVDERLVPPDHPDSNSRMIHTALASKVALPPGGFEPYRTDAGDPDAVAAHGERMIRDWFRARPEEIPRFDLIILGLGADGHTASLFPESPVLEERTRLVAPVRLPPPGRARVTMTLPLLNHARLALFLVSGRTKALALRGVLKPESSATILPAALVRPAGDPLWIVDEDAASALVPTQS